MHILSTSSALLITAQIRKEVVGRMCERACLRACVRVCVSVHVC
uniref:Uncharacterized protein n=1 Tax=Anguilla anguilla TaxID=7936 RepID=A0A0E9TGE9_ANGAN